MTFLGTVHEGIVFGHLLKCLSHLKKVRMYTNYQKTLLKGS